MRSWTCTRRLRQERTPHYWRSSIPSFKLRYLLALERQNCLNTIQMLKYTSAIWGNLCSGTSNGIQIFVLSFTSFHLCFAFVLLIQAAKRGLLSPGRGRGVHSRGRGAHRARGRGSRGRGRGVHAVVDHRPRVLEISGFTESDCVDLLPHFAVSPLENDWNISLMVKQHQEKPAP